LNKAIVKLNGKEKSLKIGANDYKHALKIGLSLTVQVGKPSATRKVQSDRLDRKRVGQKGRFNVTKMNRCYTHQLPRLIKNRLVGNRVQPA